MKGLLPLLSGFRRFRERAWREIRAARQVFVLGGFGSGGPCSCCGGTGTGGCHTKCGCVNIPDKITVTDSILGITTDLNWNGTNWAGSHVYSFPGCTVGLTCNATCPASTVTINYTSGGCGVTATFKCKSPLGNYYCPDDTGTFSQTYFSAGTPTCSPTFSEASTGNPQVAQPTYLYCGCPSPSPTFTLAAPYADSSCCVRFTVTGCNSQHLQGATVSIWTNNTKTTLIVSGTTGSGGAVVLDMGSFQGGTYYYEVSCSPRFATTSGTSIPCGSDLAITLSAASGYHCITCGGVMPLADTLHLTDSVYGTTTLSYSSGNWVSGTTAWSFPGDACCTAQSFGMVYTLTGSTCALTATYGHNPPVAGQATCPIGNIHQSDVSDEGSTTVTKPTFCGDSTAWNFSVSLSSQLCSNNSWYVYPSGATYTMTE